ncbi:hypothetical protein [Bernardetia sp.]|uniref:hypothetical protein n=1 Tax=Bernardetia sp. TaxID=1937974 RepID=UPI0025C6AE42|nr:hypothetical protein [Bernardetia sp.]
MKKHFLLYLIFLLFFSLTSCNAQKQKSLEEVKNDSVKTKSIDTTEFTQNEFEKVNTNKIPPYVEYGRDSIVRVLENKIKNNEPLFVHIFVPLCDNENQGIVPVNTSLGDGMNLRTNLYWGAGYGIKTHFKRLKEWQLLSSELDIDSLVLERVIFKKKYPNGATVFLVADAYRGDKMHECLTNYFASLAGKKKQTLQLEDNTKVKAFGEADLIAFNGHNGLMDSYAALFINQDNRMRDAVSIACSSHDFFKRHLNVARAYPLLTTTNLLAPEAYGMEAVIDAWAMLEDGASIRKKIGAMYHKIHNCGLKGATNLFHTGW